jgi:hypothetical protein
MHIDSHQNRPHWKDKTEKDLNGLRQTFADMVAAEGGLYLVFNATVYPSTYPEIPDIVRWGQANIDKVQGLVFITYRTAVRSGSVATDIHDQTVDMTKLSYTSEVFDETFITGPEVYQIIQETYPEYEAAGYLGGSVRHDSYKWLIGAMVGSKQRYYGAIGKKTMELAQIGHHLWKGTYLAYLSQARIGRIIFALSPFDKILARAHAAWWKDILRHPGRLFNPVHIQSIGIIQAPDVQPDGRADMCDSCPDITIYDGKFVNSCRMDEYRLFGGFVSVLEKENEKSQP